MLGASDWKWDEMPTMAKGLSHGLPQMTTEDWLKREQAKDKGTPSTDET
jgi:hypothetical protein